MYIYIYTSVTTSVYGYVTKQPPFSEDTLVGAVSNQNWVEMLSFAEQAIDATHWVTKNRG